MFEMVFCSLFFLLALLLIAVMFSPRACRELSAWLLANACARDKARQVRAERHTHYRKQFGLVGEAYDGGLRQGVEIPFED